jgi:hypothetical protein
LLDSLDFFPIDGLYIDDVFAFQNFIFEFRFSTKNQKFPFFGSPKCNKVCEEQKHVHSCQNIIYCFKNLDLLWGLKCCLE